MVKETKYILGASALVVAYLLWKKKKEGKKISSPYRMINTDTSKAKKGTKIFSYSYNGNVGMNTARLLTDIKNNLSNEQLKEKYVIRIQNGISYIDAFIQNDSNFKIEDLNALSITVYSNLKNILTASIPINNLEMLSNVVGVTNIEIATKVRF
jgi:hypothetical protein